MTCSWSTSIYSTRNNFTSSHVLSIIHSRIIFFNNYTGTATHHLTVALFPAATHLTVPPRPALSGTMHFPAATHHLARAPMQLPSELSAQQSHLPQSGISFCTTTGDIRVRSSPRQLTMPYQFWAIPHHQSLLRFVYVSELET